jgi:hypothetical protein
MRYFEVLKEFRNHEDGLNHSVGELIDQTLVGLTVLQRLVISKRVKLVTAAANAAA